MKNAQCHYSLKIWIKTSVRYHRTSIKTAIMKRTANDIFWPGCGTHFAGGNVTWHVHPGKQHEAYPSNSGPGNYPGPKTTRPPQDSPLLTHTSPKVKQPGRPSAAKCIDHMWHLYKNTLWHHGKGGGDTGEWSTYTCYRTDLKREALKEASHKKSNILWFYLYKMSGLGDSIEKEVDQHQPRTRAAVWGECVSMCECECECVCVCVWECVRVCVWRWNRVLQGQGFF